MRRLAALPAPCRFIWQWLCKAVGQAPSLRRPLRPPRGVLAGFILALALIASPACHRHRRPGQTDRTTIYTNDPNTADRLAGFYEIENRAWRWSGKEFAVRVRNPDKADSQGAAVVLRFTIPQSQISALGPITIRGDAGGEQLPPQTYSTAGAFEYRHNLPTSVFDDGDVTVTFTLDKTRRPSSDDRRNVGIVVESVGFEKKG